MKKLIIILLLLASSCVAKKTTIEYKERIKLDTVSVFVDREVIKSVIDTLVVEKPCDSLGNLKDFEKTIKTEKAEVTLKSVKGNIEVSVNIDSLVNEKITKFKQSYKREVDTKEVEIVRYTYPLWLIFSLIVSVLINLVLLKSKFL